MDLLNVYENLVVFYDAGLVLRFKKAGQVYDYSNQVHAILKIGINIKIVVILSKQKIPKSCDLGSIIFLWLDRQDSNLRMLGPKPSALPLGDDPICYILARKMIFHNKIGAKVGILLAIWGFMRSWD